MRLKFSISNWLQRQQQQRKNELFGVIQRYQQPAHFTFNLYIWLKCWSIAHGLGQLFSCERACIIDWYHANVMTAYSWLLVQSVHSFHFLPVHIAFGCYRLLLRTSEISIHVILYGKKRNQQGRSINWPEKKEIPAKKSPQASKMMKVDATIF